MIKYIFLLACGFANASTHFSVGFDVFQTTQKGVYKSNGNAVESPLDNMTGISIGILQQEEKFFYGFRTNGLLEFAIKNDVVNLDNGAKYSEKTKVNSKSLFVGKKIKGLATYIIATRLDTRTQIADTHYRTIEGFVGAGVGFKVLENQSLTFTYYFIPSNHETLKNMFGVSYSFYFK